MGMYDTVHFDCPHCGMDAEIQTKAGPCHLNDYQLADVPESVAEALVECDGRNYKTCYRCGVSLEFVAKVSVQITVRRPE